MASFRETIKNNIIPKLLVDVEQYRIFNEADMQYRAAHHLDKACYPELYLTNQPVIPVGQRRGKTNVKPDIVVFHPEKGPVTALELKCFIGNDNPRFSTIVKPVWQDIEKLHDFRRRYEMSSTNAFAIVLVNVEDRELFAEFQKEFRSKREEWMSHYLFIHLVNVYCDDNGRKRRWYDKWREEWRNWQKHFSGL